MSKKLIAPLLQNNYWEWTEKSWAHVNLLICNVKRDGQSCRRICHDCQFGLATQIHCPSQFFVRPSLSHLRGPAGLNIVIPHNHRNPKWMVLVGYDQEQHHYFRNFDDCEELRYLTLLVPLTCQFWASQREQRPWRDYFPYKMQGFLALLDISRESRGKWN